MLNRLLSGVALCAISTAAMAADLPSRKSAAAPVVVASPFSWTGFYIGGQLGWAGSKLSVSGEAEAAFSGSQNLSSFLAGGFAGYDHQIGSMVVGIEADANARIGSKTGTAPFSWYSGPVTWKSESEWDASLRLRIGWLATSQTLIYATGGVAWANYKFHLSDAEGLLSENKIRTGWTVGGGIQQVLTKNISLRAEYRYSDYGSKSGTFNYDYGKGGSYKSKLHDNRVTVGLAYKF
jgi:outer membrane immunogenic protein